MNKLIQPQNSTHKRYLEQMEANMLLFGKVCLPNMFQVKSPPFHREIVKVLADPALDKVNIIAPRGHAKSSLAACLLPLHHLFFHEGNKLILLSSKTEGHAIRLLQTIKNALEYSRPLQAVMGYWGEHSALKWRDNEVILKDNTMIICRGTGQHVVGLKHGDQRPTLIILDDPEDMNNTKTAEAMEYNLRWLLQVLVPTRDPRRSKIVVIGTPQHERCMVETLKETKGWKTLQYDSIVDERAHQVLWPEWWSYEKLMLEKDSCESINRLSVFYREYRCQIVGDEDQLFKESYFHYYTGDVRLSGQNEAFLHLKRLDGRDTEEVLPVNVFFGIDPASSTSQTSDFSVIMPVAVDASRRVFILPYFRKHVTPMHLATAILDLFQRYRPTRSRIESVGYQEMLREYLRSREYIPGLEIKENPRTQKSHRLETLEPMFAQGRVYMQPDMQGLKDELLLYPRGKHDDLLDGLYYATKGVYVPSHKVVRDNTHEAGYLLNEATPVRKDGWLVA